jgi:hypothetical protein
VWSWPRGGQSTNNGGLFDVNKLARLTEIYLEDFSFDDRKLTKDQLRAFIVHVRRVDEFKACHDLASIAKTMVEIGRDTVFPLVYRLIELALLLPVATTTVERAFSAMKIIKIELRNKMSDYWLNDLMVIYIVRDLFKGLDLQNIKKAFQKKKDRQMQLPRSPRHTYSKIRGMTVTCFVAIYSHFRQCFIFIYIYRELFYKLIGCVLNIIRPVV